MAKVSFIGLGVMGYPMAAHLLAAGHEVMVYNRTTAKAQQWVAQHADASQIPHAIRYAHTPREAAEQADFVMTCVGNDNDVRAVYYGAEGIFAGAKTGAILIDHTTASADLARELYADALKHGMHFIDAPVSGGQAGAENGALTTMCGGDEAVFAQAKPIMAAYSKAVTLLGHAGSGQLCKMVNQICIAGVLAGLSEAVSFASAAGLDVAQVRDVIKLGAAGSWQLENRAATMADDKFDFGFAIDWMRKDLAICFAEAEKNHAPLPMTAQVDAAYARLQAEGLGRCDTSVLIRSLTLPK
ncbi:MAG: NAD(P)-dependent oxidoreductase [Plesiomonas sp.]|uniref:NAD(P)-dependent oxidoreductase n=1 Tax=Plesiomonas sp. TaxID=2486279 RepID=UPI003EE73BD9